jgi:hypothetical protein
MNKENDPEYIDLDNAINLPKEITDQLAIVKQKHDKLNQMRSEDGSFLPGMNHSIDEVYAASQELTLESNKLCAQGIAYLKSQKKTIK